MPESPSQIRPLRMNNLSAVVTLYCEVFNASPWNDHWTKETASRRLTEAIQTPGSLGLLLWHEGQLVGGLVGYQEQWFDGSHFFLKEMFVAPNRQRQGLGTQLIHHLRRILTTQGVGRIYLLTARGSAAADFYAKHGFFVSPRMDMMSCRLHDE